jgi:hypothetical protein
MATFIHIFAEKDKASIIKNGIKVYKAAWRELNGVFVSPIIEDYYSTHQ